MKRVLCLDMQRKKEKNESPVTHQHNMKGVESNPIKRVTNHVSEHRNPFFRPYITVPL